MNQPVNNILQSLAEVVSEGDDLEHLVRPLLRLFESVTGLESTYLTKVDLERNVQTVLFSNNTRDLQLPEGLEVPWADTLCKRALDEGRAFTNDVGRCWGDSDAASDLGIVTYLSTPIRVADGELYGTLCGASATSTTLDERAHQILSLLAHLIGRQVERDRLIERLRRENRTYAEEALSDPLTGIPNRRALMRELPRMMKMVDRTGGALHLALIDLDDFKSINDAYGHDCGDRFLIEIARRLVGGARESDFVARYGGDEFVVFGAGPGDGHDHEADRQELGVRLSGLTGGRFCLDDATFDYGGASVGVVTADVDQESERDFLARADAAMYTVKRSRRGAMSGHG